MLKSVGTITATLALLAATLSYVLLVQHAFEVGISPVFQLLVDYYDWLKRAALSPFEPLASWILGAISSLFDFDLSLSKHWGDVFVLMSLYIGARAMSYWQKGERRHATERISLGIIVSFLTAVLAGLWTGDGIASGIGMTVTLVIGLLLFDLIDAAWAALRYRPEGQTFSGEFRRYLGFCLPASVLLLAIIFAGSLAFSVSILEVDRRHGALILLCASIGLAIYWALRGWMVSGDPNYRRDEPLRVNRFKNSSATQTASRMFIVMLGALSFFAMNAGHVLLIQP